MKRMYLDVTAAGTVRRQQTSPQPAGPAAAAVATYQDEPVIRENALRFISDYFKIEILPHTCCRTCEETFTWDERHQYWLVACMANDINLLPPSSSSIVPDWERIVNTQARAGAARSQGRVLG